MTRRLSNSTFAGTLVEIPEYSKKEGANGHGVVALC